MTALNHISIVQGASPLGDRALTLVESLIRIVSDSHRVRKVMDKVVADNDLATLLGIDAENAAEVHSLIVALDNALDNAVVTNVTDRLG